MRSGRKGDSMIMYGWRKYEVQPERWDVNKAYKMFVRFHYEQMSGYSDVITLNMTTDSATQQPNKINLLQKLVRKGSRIYKKGPKFVTIVATIAILLLLVCCIACIKGCFCPESDKKLLGAV